MALRRFGTAIIILLLLGPVACGFLSGDGGGPVEFSVSTADRTAGLDPDAPLEIRFTRNLDEATVTIDPVTGEGTFSVTDTRTGEKVTGSAVVTGSRIVFTPDSGLGRGVVYRVDLSGEIATRDGEALGEELALLLSTQALDRVDVEVRHPHHGWLPKLLLDVCYDVDEGAAFDLEYLRYAIENAETLADNRNLEWVEPRAELYAEPLFTKFHFWPNLINLTEVYYGDADLYTRIVEEFLEFEPDAASILPSLLDDVVAGERVFLVRDFIPFVQDAFDSYEEVHYGFLLNLDSKWVREVLVHQFADLGLPLLHDPHTSDLKALLDDGALVREGEVWTMCLRANLNPGKRQAIIVDRIDDTPEFYLRRIHATCAPPGEPPEEPPLEVAIPPPGPNPPPPGGKGGKGGKGGDEGGGDGGPVAPKNPKAPPEPKKPGGDEAPFPWPWPGPEGEGGPGEPGEGTGAPDPQNCNQAELAGIKTGLAAVQATTGAKMDARDQDVDTFAKSKWQWDGSATYNDPCLQALYDEYKAKIDPLLDQLATAQGDAAATGEAKAQSKKDLDPVLNTARIREDIWDNMLTTGGPWSNVRVPCMPPWIPAGGSPFKGKLGETILIITVEQQAQFQKDIYKGLVRGMSFDEAVNSALANGQNYPPEVVDGDKIYQLIWKTYAECLKQLYEEMAKIYLPRVYPNATEEQLTEAWKVMCEGKGALTPAQQAAFTAWQAEFDAACAKEAGQNQDAESLRKGIEDLRREFRQRALDECFEMSLMDIERCRTKMWILEDFVKSVEHPGEGDGTFIKGDYFCEVIDEMLADDPPPCLKAYLMGLKETNCAPVIR